MNTDSTTGAPTEARTPVLVLGAGGWGTALAMVLERSGCDTRVWGRNPDAMRRLERTRENERFLPGVPLPPGIRFGADLAELARGSDTIFSVVPTQFLRSTLSGLRPALGSPRTIVSCSKGLEAGTLERPSRIIAEIWSDANVVVLGGPSHAEEVSRGLPTTVVVACDQRHAADEVQALLSDSVFRTYTGRDPIGVEVGGFSKNIMAIAAGIADGLGFGDNTRAGLMTRGLREMTRLGCALGARAETFAGLSGVGDLIATCTSEHSRNRSVGWRIGRGEPLAKILASTEKVAEGVETTRSVHELAARRGVEVPITDEVHAVLFDGKSPRAAVQALLSRESREETE